MRNALTLSESICAASSAVINSEPTNSLVFIYKQLQNKQFKYLTNAYEMLYSHFISREHLISIAYIISIAHLCAGCQELSCSILLFYDQV